MKYTLLWILSLAASLLLVAFLTAWVGRREGWLLAGPRRFVLPFFATAALGCLGLLGVVTAYRVVSEVSPYADWRAYALSWTVAIG